MANTFVEYQKVHFAVTSGMCWRDTPQGVQYWAEVTRNLEKNMQNLMDEQKEATDEV